MHTADAALHDFRLQWQRDVERDVAERDAPPAAPHASHSSCFAPPRPPTAPPLPKHDTLAHMLAPLVAAHEADVAHAPLEAQTPSTTHGAAPRERSCCPRTVHEMHAADETLPFPAGTLPDEVWMRVLFCALEPTLLAPGIASLSDTMHHESCPSASAHHAWSGPDYITLENAARTCWKLRLLTSRAMLWRRVVHATYQPPQLPLYTTPDTLFARTPYSWRDLFIQQPRLRMHGAYIATCRYTQQGLSEENRWVRVFHLVEFFRYLRFFPDGQVLSMLTSDRPAETVHRLVPGERAKGMATGHWHLVCDDTHGATIAIENLCDPTLGRYVFQMTLRLGQTAPGRWNKLELLAYTSQRRGTAEVLPIPHKHMRPFLFSRVLRYGT
ncbi:hypothetical protein MVES1_003528 [Malassezia vespertilionis]|uniref:F-box protein Hrt3/FBXO9 C-terminal domain-containing protein n=1 Tax=Malassezia vespertilionis TaxID=2020962 RepID=A0A2N1J6Y0_9BASI|nr:uncharacterized protein MVES1_003528 [Malassezia vespertilionis]PKI82316.1 hypothetical protein MVES_003767 [Malassezia vespertilionis]WFD08157.1 hypothetical protein MVES1_003528 [Malassezia vespertilionis]